MDIIYRNNLTEIQVPTLKSLFQFKKFNYSISYKHILNKKGKFYLKEL